MHALQGCMTKHRSCEEQSVHHDATKAVEQQRDLDVGLLLMKEKNGDDDECLISATVLISTT